MEVSAIGGAKKKSLAQMEKTQTSQEKDATQPKKGKTKPTSTEKKLRAVELQGVNDSRLLGEIAKMGAITPYALSSQFNIRIGAAKDVLEELQRRKALAYIGGNARVRIYRAVAA